MDFVYIQLEWYGVFSTIAQKQSLKILNASLPRDLKSKIRTGTIEEDRKGIYRKTISILNESTEYRWIQYYYRD